MSTDTVAAPEVDDGAAYIGAVAAGHAVETAELEDSETGEDTFVVTLKTGERYEWCPHLLTASDVRCLRPLMVRRGIVGCPREVAIRATFDEWDLDIIDAVAWLASQQTGVVMPAKPIGYKAVDWKGTGYFRLARPLSAADTAG